MYEFSTFEEAYHQLMNELGDLTIEAINLVLPANDETANIYITGGFSKNELFQNHNFKMHIRQNLFIHLKLPMDQHLEQLWLFQVQNLP